MKRLRIITLIIVYLIGTSACFAQDSIELKKISQQLTTSIMFEGQSMEYTKQIADQFGGRITGTKSYQQAAEWAAAKFRDIGIKNVRLEPFKMAHIWQPGNATGQIISPINHRLSLTPYGWTLSTPPGGVKAEVIFLDNLFDKDVIKAKSAQIKGRIVLLSYANMLGYPDPVYSHLLEAELLLKQAGAVAIALIGGKDKNILSTYSGWGGKIDYLPVAYLGKEDGTLVKSLLKKGPVTIEFNYQNIIENDVMVNNVVAELPGREKSDEWIVVSAHLDSWTLGTGAQDNATGCAMVLEAARAIVATGKSPRRSIRFILWAGEEQGLLGSTAYLQNHAAEIKRCIAMLNADLGAGKPLGWRLNSRADLVEPLAPISKLLSPLGVNDFPVEFVIDYTSDDVPFLLKGIPALNLWTDVAPYFEVHHKTGDTVDKIDPQNLAMCSAVMAITAFAIAEAPVPIGIQIEKPALDKIFTNPDDLELFKDLLEKGLL